MKKLFTAVTFVLAIAGTRLKPGQLDFRVRAGAWPIERHPPELAYGVLGCPMVRYGALQRLKHFRLDPIPCFVRRIAPNSLVGQRVGSEEKLPNHQGQGASR